MTGGSWLYEEEHSSMLQEHSYMLEEPTGGVWLYDGGAWLYAGGPWLYDACTLVATTFCLQHPSAAHALRSEMSNINH